VKDKLIKKIESAKVYDVAIVSPLDYAKVVSARLGNKILTVNPYPADRDHSPICKQLGSR